MLVTRLAAGVCRNIRELLHVVEHRPRFWETFPFYVPPLPLDLPAASDEAHARSLIAAAHVRPSSEWTTPPLQGRNGDGFRPEGRTAKELRSLERAGRGGSAAGRQFMEGAASGTAGEKS